MGLRGREKKIISYEIRHLDKVILAIVGFAGVVLLIKGMLTILEELERTYSFDPLLFIFFGLVIIFLTGAMIKG